MNTNNAQHILFRTLRRKRTSQTRRHFGEQLTLFRLSESKVLVLGEPALLVDGLTSDEPLLFVLMEVDAN